MVLVEGRFRPKWRVPLDNIGLGLSLGLVIGVALQKIKDKRA
jgi:hypothetical protein